MLKYLYGSFITLSLRDQENFKKYAKHSGVFA